jgi:hypothetical protein
MAIMANNSVLTTTNSQQHFNWGFWDAASDVSHSRAQKWVSQAHPNGTYQAGYLAGWKAAKAKMATEETSGVEWDLHLFHQ